MSLLKMFVSAPAAALGVVVGLSGCILEMDDEWHTQHECSVDARTRGAYDGRVTDVEGCSSGRASITTSESGPDLERRVGVFPKDGFPFDHLEVIFFRSLDDEGDGLAVTIAATTKDGVSWVTPDGACTASYVARPCDYEGDEPGRQYVIGDVECSEPAAAEGKQDLVIEDFLIISACDGESQW